MSEERVFCSGCGSSRPVKDVDDAEVALCQRCLDDNPGLKPGQPSGSQRGAPVSLGTTTGIWLGPDFGARQ